jgi:hypothetical membrane protein
MATYARTNPLPIVHARDRASRDELRLAGMAFVTIGAAFVTLTMLAASLAPGYDVADGAISDLGVIPQTAWLFNGLLVVIGVLNGGAGLLLYRQGASARLLAIYVLAEVGAIGAGVFPLDRGGLHSLFALGAFVFFNLEAIATGAVFQGPMRLVGIVAGAIGLLYVGVMVVGDAGNPAVFGAIGHGGAERLIVYPSMLWLIAAGGYLLGRDAPAEDGTTGRPPA